jgi:ssDNA-binding Zn-finger/Zn-ribbon topoisomerase 1
MVYYKSCPKCRGDMHIRKDVYGDFKECIQCGLLQDLIEKPSMELAGIQSNSNSNKPQGNKGKAA